MKRTRKDLVKAAAPGFVVALGGALASGFTTYNLLGAGASAIGVGLIATGVLWNARGVREAFLDAGRNLFQPPPGGVPLAPAIFVGAAHKSLATSLENLLTDGGGRLVAVIGPVGSGKSAVCEKAVNANKVRMRFLVDTQVGPVQRRYWTDLERCGPDTVEERISRSVGAASFAAAMRALGDGKPALVVLDNADRAFVEAPSFDPVLSQLASCAHAGATVIVTIRSVDTLPSVEWDAMLVAELFTAAAARELFNGLAPMHANSDVAEALLAPCEGVPLAVSLIGRLAATSGDLAALTSTSISSLHIGTGSNRRSSIDYAVAVAAGQMDVDERAAWAALSCFPAGLGEGEIDVLGLGPFAVNHVARLYHLGIATRAGAGMRVPLPLRMAAQSTDAMWQRYTSVACDVVAQGAGARQWLSAQQPNLEVLAEQHPIPAGIVDLGCQGLIIAPDATDERLQTTLAKLVAAGIDDGPLPERIASTIEALRDNHQPRIKLLTIAVTVHRRTGNSIALANTLSDHGQALRGVGRLDEADALFVEAQAIYDRIGNEVGKANARESRGEVAMLRGQLDEADALFVEAQSIYDHIGNEKGQANARQSRGGLAWLRDQYEDAELLLIEAQAIYERMDDRKGQAEVRQSRSEVAMLQGRYDEATALLIEAQAICDHLGDELGLAHAKQARGGVAWLQGRYDEAEALLVDAQVIYDRSGDQLGLAHTRRYLGEVAMSRRRYDQAEALLVRAQAMYDGMGDQLGQAQTRQSRGEVAICRGRYDEAEALLVDAQTINDHIGDRQGQANARYSRGRVAISRGRYVEAERLFVDAQAIYDRNGNGLGQANIRQARAEAYDKADELIELAAGNRRAMARSLYVEASDFYRKIGRADWAGRALAGAARCAETAGNRSSYAARGIRDLRESGKHQEALRMAQEFGIAETGGTFIAIDDRDNDAPPDG